ncbi:MarR family winged helix-turn-helix transcriptional regulator [Streptomonospora sediminis]
MREKADEPRNRDVVDDILDSWRTELPEIAGLPLELFKRAARLTALLDHQTGAQLDRMNLTRAEFDILATLRRAPAPHRLLPSELSQRLLLSSGGTSNVLRRLIDSALVERHANASDRRSSWVQLTDRGIEVAEQAVRMTARGTAHALRDADPATTRAAADDLRDVLTAMGDIAPSATSPVLRAHSAAAQGGGGGDREAQ